MARRRTPADGSLPPTLAEGGRASPVGTGVATPAGTAKKRGRRRTFREGDLVAGRYRIVRFIAEGGMGEVFEARALELDTPIALKTIRREHLKDASVVARFKREIQLARQVTHRNVCRIFDLERQDTGG